MGLNVFSSSFRSERHFWMGQGSPATSTPTATPQTPEGKIEQAITSGIKDLIQANKGTPANPVVVPPPPPPASSSLTTPVLIGGIIAAAIVVALVVTAKK